MLFDVSNGCLASVAYLLSFNEYSLIRFDARKEIFSYHAYIC